MKKLITKKTTKLYHFKGTSPGNLSQTVGDPTNTTITVLTTVSSVGQRPQAHVKR